MQPETRRLLIQLATAAFLLVAGVVWYFGFIRSGDIAQAAKAECAPYVEWHDNILANYSCQKISEGCVVGGFFYNPCPSLNDGRLTLNFTNKSA